MTRRHWLSRWRAFRNQRRYYRVKVSQGEPAILYPDPYRGDEGKAYQAFVSAVASYRRQA